MNVSELEGMAAALDSSGRYRVLRKLQERPVLEPVGDAETRLGLVVDVETTGLDPAHCEIIEIAMVPFTYGVDGRVFEIHEPFQGLRQPKTPIPAEITALTGISDEMVLGQSIDPADVAAFAKDASLVVAHNASFDRRFLEDFCETFVKKPWACSMAQVDWAAEGYEGRKLAYLSMEAGFFYNRHRATDDCRATIELLARMLPRTQVPAMVQLLEKARRASVRIWAENSPFDLKDLLKARGYRWNGDGGAGPRSWYIDVDEAEKGAEIAYLNAEIYKRPANPRVQKVTAYDRFSGRC